MWFIFGCVQKKYLAIKVVYSLKHQRIFKNALSVCFGPQTYQWFSWRGKSHKLDPIGGRKKTLAETLLVDTISGDQLY